MYVNVRLAPTSKQSHSNDTAAGGADADNGMAHLVTNIHSFTAAGAVASNCMLSCMNFHTQILHCTTRKSTFAAAARCLKETYSSEAPPAR
jgi:hypothetical protein